MFFKIISKTFDVDVGNVSTRKAFGKDNLVDYLSHIVQLELHHLTKSLKPGWHKIYTHVVILDLSKNHRQCHLKAMLKFNSVEEAVMFRLSTGYEIEECLDEIYENSFDRMILDLEAEGKEFDILA